jgi:hypothetical protein
MSKRMWNVSFLAAAESNDAIVLLDTDVGAHQSEELDVDGDRAQKKHHRDDTCRICNLHVVCQSEEDLEVHERACIVSRIALVQNKLPPIGCVSGDRFVTHWASGIPDSIQDDLLDVMGSKNFFANQAARVGYFGDKRDVGWNPLTRNVFRGSVALKRMPSFERLTEAIAKLPVVLEAKSCARAMETSGAYPNRSVVFPVIEGSSKDKYSCNYVFTQNFQARWPVPESEPAHGVPGTIASKVQSPACSQSCSQCQLSCDGCLACVLHKSEGDKSLTVLVMYQMPTPVPIGHIAYYSVDNESYPMTDGLCIVMDGAFSTHGAWCALTDDVPMSSSWYGVECVLRF